MKLKEFKRSDYADKSGIYKLSIGGHIYIGSSKNLGAKLSEHKVDLFNGNHANDFLQKVFNKYGSDNLDIEIVEYCNPEVRFDRERYWIAKLEADMNLSDPVTLAPLTEEQLKKFRDSANEARKIRVNKLEYETPIECYDYFGDYIKTYKNAHEAAKEIKTNAWDIQDACGGYKKGLTIHGYRFRYQNSKVSVQSFNLNPMQICRKLNFYYLDENGKEQIAFTSIKNIFKFFAEHVSKYKGKPIIIIPKTKTCSEEWNGLGQEVNHIPSSIESIEKDQRLDEVALSDGAEGKTSTSAAL